MEIKLTIRDEKIKEFLNVCDLIIEQNKDSNHNAWALGVDLKRMANKAKEQSLKNN